MPRRAREVGNSGYYHIMMRGNGRAILFESNDDRRLFLRLLSSRLDERFSVIAWCLMSNHVHILISDPDNRKSTELKWVLSMYAQHYNESTGHVGHVFQDRFLSKPIETERYLMTAVRYIHSNPEAEGICAQEDYEWSSYHEYANGCPGIVSNLGLLYEMIGGKTRFLDFSKQTALDYSIIPQKRAILTEENARQIAEEELGTSNIQLIGVLSLQLRNEFLYRLRDRGISIRQAERITGLGRGLIDHVYRNADSKRIEGNLLQMIRDVSSAS